MEINHGGKNIRKSSMINGIGQNKFNKIVSMFSDSNITNKKHVDNFGTCDTNTLHQNKGKSIPYDTFENNSFKSKIDMWKNKIEQNNQSSCVSLEEIKKANIFSKHLVDAKQKTEQHSKQHTNQKSTQESKLEFVKDNAHRIKPVPINIISDTKTNKKTNNLKSNKQSKSIKMQDTYSEISVDTDKKKAKNINSCDKIKKISHSDEQYETKDNKTEKIVQKTKNQKVVIKKKIQKKDDDDDDDDYDPFAITTNTK